MSKFKFASAMMKEWEQSSNTMDSYNKGRADEREHIISVLYRIDSYVAELVEEILNNEEGAEIMVKNYNGETYIIPKEFEDEVRKDERKKAEQDFQNSDYWNEYLEKVIADARADAFKEFVEAYRDFYKAPFEEACRKKEVDECDGMCIDCFEKWFKEKK